MSTEEQTPALRLARLARLAGELAEARALGEDPGPAREALLEAARVWTRQTGTGAPDGETRQIAALIRQLGYAATQVENGAPRGIGISSALAGLRARAVSMGPAPGEEQR